MASPLIGTVCSPRSHNQACFRQDRANSDEARSRRQVARKNGRCRTLSAPSTESRISRHLCYSHSLHWPVSNSSRDRPPSTGGLEQGDQNKPEYRALQPFGQVPVFEEKGLLLFESGAIVLHIAERSEVLLPKDPAARARAV